MRKYINFTGLRKGETLDFGNGAAGSGFDFDVCAEGVGVLGMGGGTELGGVFAFVTVRAIANMHKSNLVVSR